MFARAVPCVVRVNDAVSRSQVVQAVVRAD